MESTSGAPVTVPVATTEEPRGNEEIQHIPASPANDTIPTNPTVPTVSSLDDDEEYDTSANFTEDGKQREPIPPTPPEFETLAQKNPKATDHLSMTIGGPIIIFFDLVVPCIIYYAWYNSKTATWGNECRPYTDRGESCPIEKPEFDRDILGYAIISFGFGELYILLARVARLIQERELCAPLLSRSRWELDATSWVYAVAMVCALIPFVIGSTREIPMLYLYSPAFLMFFLLALMVMTLIPFPIPIGINSHARGTPMRPFIYYAAEDFIAVDGLQDREFRVRYNARYNSSKAFRRLFIYLTLWWIFGILVYIGCLSALIWNVEFHYAFGGSLGILFSYIVIWAIVSYLWVQIEMDRERKAYERKSEV